MRMSLVFCQTKAHKQSKMLDGQKNVDFFLFLSTLSIREIFSRNDYHEPKRREKTQANIPNFGISDGTQINII